MNTVDLKQWPRFRKESLKLSSDLSLMVKDVDEVMKLSISDDDKTSKVSNIVSKYLPEDEGEL